MVGLTIIYETTAIKSPQCVLEREPLPKIVDRDDRREEVCGAAMRILARGGSSALTLRSLAEELNGSITLVTHFFSNRADLFEAITDDLLSSWDASVDWKTSDDPLVNLRQLVSWLVPETPEEVQREASRVALISARNQAPSIDNFYIAMEAKSRSILTEAVVPLVPERSVSSAVDALRASVNGLVLSVVEHPKHWTNERREKYVEFILAGFNHMYRH